MGGGTGGFFESCVDGQRGKEIEIFVDSLLPSIDENDGSLSGSIAQKIIDFATEAREVPKIWAALTKKRFAVLKERAKETTESSELVDLPVHQPPPLK